MKESLLYQVSYYLAYLELTLVIVFAVALATSAALARWRRARHERLCNTGRDVLARGLNVMDSTAISLCKENNLPILVFDMLERNNIRRVVCGEEIGTLVCPDGQSVLAGQT